MLYIIAALIGFLVAGLHGAVVGVLLVIGFDLLIALLIGVIWVLCAVGTFLDKMFG